MKRKRLYGAAKRAHQKRLKRERDKRYRERNKEKIKARRPMYRARQKLREIRDEQGKSVFIKTDDEELLTLIYIGYPH